MFEKEQSERLEGEKPLWGVGRGGGWGCGSPWHQRAVLCPKGSDAQTVPTVGVCTAGSRLRYRDLASSTLGAARIHTAPGCLLLVQRPYVSCSFHPVQKSKSLNGGQLEASLHCLQLCLPCLSSLCFVSPLVIRSGGNAISGLQGGGKITWAACRRASMSSALFLALQ